jgi:hypothetical protein
LLRPEENQTKAIKPSLLSTSHEAEVANNRILANFEIGIIEQPKPVRSWRSYRERRFLLLGMLTILAAGTGGVTCIDALPPIRNVTNQSLLAVEGTPVRTSSYASVPKRPFDAESEKQVASIINEQDEQGRLTELGKSGLEINSASVKESPAPQGMVSSAGDSSKQAPNSAKSGESQSTLKDKTRTAGPTSLVRNNSTNSRQESKSGQKLAKQANGLPKEKPDRDVTLLTALIAHTNENQARRAGFGNTEQRAANRIQQPAKSRLPQTSMAYRAENEQSREIVERKPNDSSDALLQRCKQLGLIEGQLCRWRICSGRWESDAACKASAGQS